MHAASGALAVPRSRCYCSFFAAPGSDERYQPPKRDASMNTQNVNVKTATQEHSERYEERQLEPWEKEGVRNPLAVRALLMEFTYLEDMSEAYAENILHDDDLEEALYEIFRRMTELAAGCSVVYSKDEKPKVDYEIIQYWVKAQRYTREWFGVIGERAFEHARYRLDLTLRVENSYR
jgi:hypothetical protein